MKTRLGKIAQLPKSIRDDLNHRLENGKQSPELLEWLNSLPETQDLITQKFANQPITRSNLSDWRHGGFAEWRADQLREARIQRICETGGSLEQAETGDLFEHFARITVAEMMTDLDSVQKLRGEKRSRQMHHLVCDLARLQNSYNRSRWAALAWLKYKDIHPDEPSDLPLPRRIEAEAGTPSVELKTSNATPSTPTSVVPDGAGSQAMDPDDPEPKPNGNGMYVLHFTDCSCDEPCPQCHAPDSDYPLEDAIRDDRYYRKHHRYPCDRHGKERFLINVVCACPCDRCAEKTSAGSIALPLDPIIHQAESLDENPSVGTTPPPPSPIRQISPIPPIQLTDFRRKMSHLKSISE